MIEKEEGRRIVEDRLDGIGVSALCRNVQCFGKQIAAMWVNAPGDGQSLNIPLLETETAGQFGDRAERLLRAAHNQRAAHLGGV